MHFGTAATRPSFHPSEIELGQTIGSILDAVERIKPQRLVIDSLSTLAVTSVGAAVKALRRFAADVIVSDIAMPGEDGYALMRRLRDIEPALTPPVIVMTAAVPDILRRLPRQRVSSIVNKPFDLDQLLREADDAIRKHAAP